ncbi:hypothetical protein F4810DRAFT_404246 [Camillea tinctor]|nr:hypothetical protein F4810DRAFT_404246 [Camillea tinctor]
MGDFERGVLAAYLGESFRFEQIRIGVPSSNTGPQKKDIEDWDKGWNEASSKSPSSTGSPENYFAPAKYATAKQPKPTSVAPSTGVRTNTVCRADCSSHPSSQDCRPLFKTIRKLFSATRAQRIISAIHELPAERRDRLLSYPNAYQQNGSGALSLKTSCEIVCHGELPTNVSGSNGPSQRASSSGNSYTQSVKSPRVVNSPAAARDGKKREVPPGGGDDNDDDPGEDKSPRVPADPDPPQKRLRLNENLPCAIPFAHPDLPNQTFPCQKANSFRDRSSLKKHYKTCHTQEAMQDRQTKGQSVDPRFYLTHDQFNDIVTAIRNSDGKGRRGRGPDNKARTKTELLRNIWRIICGNHEVPEGLLSPHTQTGYQAPSSFKDQLCEMFDVMLRTKEGEAVASSNDFQFSRAEAMGCFNRAWQAVAMTNSDISSQSPSVGIGVSEDTARTFNRSSDETRPRTGLASMEGGTGDSTVINAGLSNPSTSTGASPSSSGTSIYATRGQGHHVRQILQILAETEYSKPKAGERDRFLLTTLPPVITFRDPLPSTGPQANPMPPSNMPWPGIQPHPDNNCDFTVWNDFDLYRYLYENPLLADTPVGYNPQNDGNIMPMDLTGP